LDQEEPEGWLRPLIGLFLIPHGPAVAEQEGIVMTSNEPPLLTREGRARLEERARRLEEETIPALVEAIDEEDDEMAPRLEQDLAQRELEQLKYVLETAGSVYDIPEDPGVVQIGDWVTVKTEEGEEVRHLLVHPAEAGVDTDRISADSPLASAILGRRVSEEVTIEAPSGAYRATIIESKRSEV
jgi:transcription elongation GreA/GreB family factor